MSKEPQDDPDESSEQPDAPLTRTERTRAASEVNRLGGRLVELHPSEIDGLDLPERLREEIALCQRLKPRARARQIRLIGQLLRADDPEAVRTRFDALVRQRRAGVQHEHRNEAWVDRLIDRGPDEVEALLASHSGADRQRLRQLVRNAARAEEGTAAAKRARKALLRAVRDARTTAAHISDTPNAPPDADTAEEAP